MHVFKMRRRGDDLITLDDNVGGEASDRRVITASEDPESDSAVIGGIIN